MVNQQFAQTQLKESLENQPVKKPDEEYAAAHREIGTTKEVDGETKYWSGQNYGWQSKGSYDKLDSEHEFSFGSIARKRLTQSAGAAIQEHTPQAVKDFAGVAVKKGVAVFESTPEWFQQTAKFGLDVVSYAGEVVGDEIAETYNVDPVLGELTFDLLSGAAAAKTTAVQARKGAIRLAMNMDAPVVYAGKDLPRPGSRGRYLTQDEFDVVQPQRIRDARDVVDAAQETVQNIEEANPGIPKKVLKADGESGYKAAVRKKEDGMAKVSSEESNILTPTPDNQYAFPRDSPRAKEIKARVFKENEELGRAVEQLEMHHLFPKGISAAIYNRVRDFIEVGDAVPGDLTRVAGKLKKATGIDTGDLESNIEAMRKTPHSTFHNEMRYQPSGTFKGQKLEISKEKLTTELRKVKNLKDLEVLLDTFLEEDIIPLIKNAKIWEKMDDDIMSVSPKYTGKAKYKP